MTIICFRYAANRSAVHLAPKNGENDKQYSLHFMDDSCHSRLTQVKFIRTGKCQSRSNSGYNFYTYGVRIKIEKL